jgi:hypothetical protein
MLPGWKIVQARDRRSRIMAMGRDEFDSFAPAVAGRVDAVIHLGFGGAIIVSRSRSPIRA